MASSATDREKEASYFMVVVARDGGGVQQTVPLSVTITDSNDNSPVFLRDQYYVILDEGSTTFSRSVTVQVSHSAFFFWFVCLFAFCLNVDLSDVYSFVWRVCSLVISKT